MNCVLFGHLSVTVDVQHHPMSHVLPFDIIALIIVIEQRHKSEVSHNLIPSYRSASSKKGFVKLLKGRPKVVNYIPKILYKLSYNNDDHDHLLFQISSQQFLISTPHNHRFASGLFPDDCVSTIQTSSYHRYRPLKKTLSKSLV